MGAAYDSTLAFGRDAAEAFRAMSEQAQWEHGHGGYSGTLAEKRSFALVTLPPRMKASKLETLASDYYDLSCNAAYRGWHEERAPSSAEGKAEARTRRKAEAKLQAFERRFSPQALHAIKQAAEVAHGDKWGPAACVELRGEELAAAKKRAGRERSRVKAYRFFGYCSS